MPDKYTVLTPELYAYAVEHGTRPDGVLERLAEETEREFADVAIMQIAPDQGAFMTLLLRLMGAAPATNFFIDTGALDATIIATDGEEVQPIKGNFFQLSTAQRLDLLVTIPEAGGVFPILA